MDYKSDVALIPSFQVSNKLNQTVNPRKKELNLILRSSHAPSPPSARWLVGSTASGPSRLNSDAQPLSEDAAPLLLPSAVTMTPVLLLFLLSAWCHCFTHLWEVCVFVARAPSRFDRSCSALCTGDLFIAEARMHRFRFESKKHDGLCRSRRPGSPQQLDLIAHSAGSPPPPSSSSSSCDAAGLRAPLVTWHLGAGRRGSRVGEGSESGLSEWKEFSISLTLID